MLLKSLGPFILDRFHKLLGEEILPRPWLIGIIAGMLAPFALHLLNQHVFPILPLLSWLKASGYHWLVIFVFSSFFLLFRWFRVHRLLIGIFAFTISIGAFFSFHALRISLYHQNSLIDLSVLKLITPEQWQYVLPFLYGLSLGLLAFPFSALFISPWKSQIVTPIARKRVRPGLYWAPDDPASPFSFMTVVPPNASMNVVFVHGVDGHYKKTWQNATGDSWPCWIADSFPNVAVASYQYSAATSAILGSAMSLENQAAHLCFLLKEVELLRKKTLFIAYSFGGLLIKRVWRIIADSQESIRRDNFLGIIFLSTPHNGSILADYLIYWSKKFSLLSPNRKLINNLLTNREAQKDLDRYWSDPPGFTRIYFETRKTAGYMVVDEKSAKPEHTLGIEATPLDCDHISIAKPEDRNDILVISVNHIIEDLLAKP